MFVPADEEDEFHGHASQHVTDAAAETTRDTVALRGAQRRQERRAQLSAPGHGPQTLSSRCPGAHNDRLIKIGTVNMLYQTESAACDVIKHLYFNKLIGQNPLYIIDLPSDRNPTALLINIPYICLSVHRRCRTLRPPKGARSVCAFCRLYPGIVSRNC